MVIDLGPDGVARCVREVGIGFCFAQRFHPAMRFAAPVRRELGTPTTFNFLGPLANPAGVDPPHRRRVRPGDGRARRSRTLATLGVERALVFYGHDGLDELTVTTTSTVYELERRRGAHLRRRPARLRHPARRAGRARRGRRRRQRRRPSTRCSPGRTARSATSSRSNAAAALVVGDVAPDLARRRRARPGACIDDGRAAATLEAFVRVSVAARESGDRLMAHALECPACGHRHRLDDAPDVRHVPLRAVRSGAQGADAGRARSRARRRRRHAAARTVDAPARRRRSRRLDRATTNAPPATAPRARRRCAPPPRCRPPSPPPRPADDANGSAGDAGRGAAGRAAPAAAPAKRSKVHWYWRLLAWIVAVPLGFVITAWPAYEFGFIKKDDVLDIFVGTGTGRYVRLAHRHAGLGARHRAAGAAVRRGRARAVGPTRASHGPAPRCRHDAPASAARPAATSPASTSSRRAAPGRSTTSAWAASSRSRTKRSSTRRSRPSPAAGAGRRATSIEELAQVERVRRPRHGVSCHTPVSELAPHADHRLLRVRDARHRRLRRLRRDVRRRTGAGGGPGDRRRRGAGRPHARQGRTGAAAASRRGVASSPPADVRRHVGPDGRAHMDRTAATPPTSRCCSRGLDRRS